MDFEEWFELLMTELLANDVIAFNNRMAAEAAWVFKQKRVEKLEAENAKLRQGLELYAKVGVWGIDKVGAMTAIDPSDHEDIFHQEIGITTRGGKLARQILKEVEDV